jgi:nicotinate-nucleotide adenylyltransferase
VTVALFGGAFDPPHVGHVALLEAARERFGPEELRVFVVSAPGHKDVAADAPTRLRLAQAAFPEAQVVLDDHPFTVDMLRDLELDDPLFLIGADEWRDFATWKEPDEVLRLARIAVASRPGHPRLEGDVQALEIDQRPISSSEIRARVAAGQSVDDLVPAEVAREIERRGIYGSRLPSSEQG